MTDDISDAEFAPIAAAMKELPYFAPSSHFADEVMSRVRIAGAMPAPVAAQRQVVAPGHISPPVRRESYLPASPDLRRSIPARFVAKALAVSFAASVSAVILLMVFNVDILVLVTRIFGRGAVSFILGLVADGSTVASTTAASSAAAAGTAAGAAIIGSFIAGAAVATAGLKAAASANRKAA